MKILLINTLYYPNLVGGAEKSVQQLAEKLYELGHEPVILCTDKIDKINYVNEIKVIYLHHRNVYWGNESKEKPLSKKVFWHSKDVYNWSMKKKIQEIIDDEKPDVVHTNNLSGFSVVPWIVAKERGIPVVHTLRDYYLLCPQSAMFKDDKNCDKRCAACSLLSEYKKKLTNRHYISHVVGISQFIIDRHKQYGFFNDVPYSKIFNGILPPISQKREKVSNELIFLFIGRFEKNKGVHHLLDTFIDLDDVSLWLGGEVNDPVILRNIKQKAYPKNIKFLGYIDPNKVFPKVDALIIPSLWHEPFGRVIFEAYSYGVPVIGAKRGGIPEIIVEGTTGFIYDPDHKGQLKNLILSLRDHPEILRNISDLPNPYYDEISLDVTVSRYVSIYNDYVVDNVDKPYLTSSLT